jgi:hypothetical protein
MAMSISQQDTTVNKRLSTVVVISAVLWCCSGAAHRVDRDGSCRCPASSRSTAGLRRDLPQQEAAAVNNQPLGEPRQVSGRKVFIQLGGVLVLVLAITCTDGT